jgi:ABC-type glycerol-3-phosphate transport system substrate-binding protein
VTAKGDANAGSVSRRVALGALGAAALGVALWPRTPRSRAGVPSGRTVITYWEKWTGPEGESLQRVVDWYNESQDKVWVTRVPVSDIMSKAMVAIGGGDPPDVCGLYSYNVAPFAEARAAMPLDEFASRPGAGIDPDSYVPSVRRLLSYQGKQWGGVTSVYALALYYNRAQFREAGLDPGRPPRTIDELDAASKRLTRLGGSGEIERAGFLQNLPEWWPYFWPIMFGGRLYDPTTNKAILTDAPTLAAYRWVGQTAARIGPEAARRFANAYGRSFHSPQDPYMSGRVSMIVQGPWIANFIRLYTPDLDYAAAPVPVEASIYDPERPAGMVEADILVIPRGCRHPEEAFAFVKWMQRPEVQARLSSEHAKSSPMNAVPAGFYENHPNKYVKVHEAITRSERVQILPQTRVWQQYADMTLGAFQSIWQGAATEPILRDVEARVQQLIDLAAERRAERERREKA